MILYANASIQTRGSDSFVSTSFAKLRLHAGSGNEKAQQRELIMNHLYKIPTCHWVTATILESGYHQNFMHEVNVIAGNMFV